QAVGDFPFAQPQGFQVGGDGPYRGFVIQAVVLARIDAAAHVLVGVPLLPLPVGEGLAFHVDHLFDRQDVLAREGEVALVVGGNAHDGAVAVGDQHVVADPCRNLAAAQRVDHGEAGGHALFFHGGEIGLDHAAALAFGDEGG